MPDDSSSDQPFFTDIYQNDPYRKRRVTNHHGKIVWQFPSKSTPHSYLPYSDYSSQQQHQQQHQEILSSTPRTDSLASNGFLSEQQEQAPSSLSPRQGMTKENVRQDSLLTTITTTARTSSTLVAAHPFLHSGATTLSLSEELRKQKYQDTTACWHWPSLLLFPCCGRRRHGRRRPSWRWLCFMTLFFLLSVGGILLFICFPRLPLVSMAQTADTYGQELAEWGPPQKPFYRTTWQLNLTLDNRPNFIPLHITQMDLVLRLHPSSSLNDTTTTTTTTTSLSQDSASTATNVGMTTSPPPLTDGILPSGSANHNITTTPNNIPSSATNQSHSIVIRPPPPPPPPQSATASVPVPSASLAEQQNNTLMMVNNDTTVPFAWSTLPSMTLSTDGKHQVVNAIFHIDYMAPTSNLTDPTFAQLYKCGPHIITDPPALNVSLHITFHILDYLWAPTMTVYPSDGNGLICPAN